MDSEQDKHWLYRKKNLPILKGVPMLILVLAVLPEFFMHHHAHFGEQGIYIDATMGFFAWYGFLTCAAMVVGAKLLGVFLKREDTHYDD